MMNDVTVKQLGDTIRSCGQSRYNKLQTQMDFPQEKETITHLRILQLGHHCIANEKRAIPE